MKTAMETVVNEKVIAIIHVVDESKILSVAEALCQSGIRLAKITFSNGSK
ncbi:MAG: hypothetical protein ACI4DY_09115 [Monoglobaceae bacterium]